MSCFDRLCLTEAMVIETGGALQSYGEDLELLLPDSQQQRRARDRRNARLAINVSQHCFDRLDVN